MRSFLILILLLTCSCLFAQRNPGDYYQLSGKIDAHDTNGLYSIIFKEQVKNADKFYDLLLKGDYLMAANNPKEAFNNYNSALDIVKNGEKDTLYALANYKIGVLQFISDNFPEALKYMNRASLVYNFKPQTFQQARLYNYIGNIHYNLPSNELAVKCYITALNFYKKKNNLKWISSTYNNLGILYTSRNDFANAQKYHDSALTIRKKLNDFYTIGQSYNNFGTMHYAMSEFQKALDYFKLGYENRITGKAPVTGLIESQINIGKSYLKLKDNANAKYWLEQSFEQAKSTHNFELQKRASESLKDLYYTMNDFKKAYELQELYFMINDSLYGMDKKNIVENLTLQNQFETKIRQDSLSNFERVRAEKIVTEEKEKRSTIMLYVLLAGIIFLSVFVFQLYKSNANKKRANAIILAQRDTLDLKQREIIDSINYAKRIQDSLLTSEKYIERTIKRLKDKS